MSIVKAAQDNDLMLVKELIKEASQESIKEAFFQSCRKGQFEMIKALIEEGVDINKEEHNSHMTPLFITSYFGYLEIVKYLIENGASVNNPITPPLFGASMRGQFSIVKLLLEKGANINTEDNNNMTPLFIASYFGYLEIVKYLIEHGANVNCQRTPLFGASIKGQLEIAQILIENGADIHQSDFFFNLTPICMATNNGHFELVKYFIQHNETQTSKRNLFHLSCLKKHKNIALFLLNMDPMLSIDIQTGKMNDLNVIDFYYKSIAPFLKSKLYDALKLKKMTDCFLQFE